MFYGLPEYLVMLCELLAQNNLNQAKGVYIRNGLKLSDFNKVAVGGKSKFGENIEKHKYN